MQGQAKMHFAQRLHKEKSIYGGSSSSNRAIARTLQTNLASHGLHTWQISQSILGIFIRWISLQATFAKTLNESHLSLSLFAAFAVHNAL